MTVLPRGCEGRTVPCADPRCEPYSSVIGQRFCRRHLLERRPEPAWSADDPGRPIGQPVRRATPDRGQLIEFCYADLFPYGLPVPANSPVEGTK